MSDDSDHRKEDEKFSFFVFTNGTLTDDIYV